MSGGLVRSAKTWLKKAARPVGSMVAVRTTDMRVALTFDDGPEPGGTDAVLSALAEHRVFATFFVLLSRVRLHPSMLGQIQAAGHEVALHGVDHRRLTRLPIDDVRRRMRDGRAELEDLTGAPVRWVRPPYGAQSLRVWRAATSAGLAPVFWGPSLHDWREDTDEARLSGAWSALAPGAIVLGHDGHAGPADGAEDGPAPRIDKHSLVSRFIDGVTERGYRAGSLGELLACGRPALEARFRS